MYSKDRVFSLSFIILNNFKKVKLMEWYQILIAVLGGLGGLGGISAFIITLYNAKVNRESIEVDNTDKLLEASNKLIAKLEEEKQKYEDRVDRKILEYGEKLNKLQSDNDAMKLAIYNAWRCRLYREPKDCPVISQYSRYCENCTSLEIKEP